MDPGQFIPGRMTLPQNCATCGKSLEDRQPPTCPRCKTLYCGSDCQRADWKAGHKKICKAIAEEGGAAQRHANEKAAEAVAALLKERAAPAKTACRLCKKTTSDEFVAVWCEKCQTKDRLAHASCLAKYAARVAEGVDDFRGWERCKGCTQEFQGAAKVAAARLCWKEYAGRNESDQLRCWATEALGCALYADGQYEDARDTFLAHLKVIKSAGVNWQDTETPLAMTRENLAKCAHALGRLDELLAMRREMYAETSAKHFVTDQRTIDAALNLASALLSSDETEEAQKFCRETLRKLKRGCPPNDARVVTCVEINQCVGCTGTATIQHERAVKFRFPHRS